MINSRNVDDLLPEAQVLCHRLIAECAQQGIDLLVTSTYRDRESQNALYAQGRTKPGKIVTNAKGGQSFHNYKIAFDAVPIVNGKPDWDNVGRWKTIGALGEKIGLEWAGSWTSFKEMAHFQLSGYKIVNGTLVPPKKPALTASPYK